MQHLSITWFVFELQVKDPALANWVSVAYTWVIEDRSSFKFDFIVDRLLISLDFCVGIHGCLVMWMTLSLSSTFGATAGGPALLQLLFSAGCFPRHHHVGRLLRLFFLS